MSEALPHPRASLRARLLLFGLATVMSLAAAEIVMRAAGPFSRAGKTPDSVLWEPDSGIGFVPAPRLDITFFSSEWQNRVLTDENGFRVPALPSEAVARGTNSILFLGDSQTMGIQVPGDATFVELIGQDLRRRGLSWTAINAGCNGFNTAQEYLFFERLFARGLRPSVVVLYATNNDLIEDVAGLPYGRYRVDEHGLVVGEHPEPLALERLRRSRASPPIVPNVWLRRSALLRNIRYGYRVLRSPQDVAGWVGSLYLRDGRDAGAPARWAATAAAIRSLRRLVTSYGGTLVIAVHPDPVEWSDEHFSRLRDGVPDLAGRIDRLKFQSGYRAIAARQEIPFIDTLAGFPAADVRDFRFALDPHANESGHRILARQLLKGLDRLGIFDRPMRTDTTQ